MRDQEPQSPSDVVVRDQGQQSPSDLVVHRIAPVFDASSRVLVLGTMPSPLSREVGFYYGNPRNRFWQVISALWDEDMPAEGTDVVPLNGWRRDLCLRHHVALWDVLASCRIRGASDSSIVDPRPNDIASILAQAPIAVVFTTGTTATRLYRSLVEPVCGIGCVGLPSTSPANARMRLADLVCAYAPLREAADTGC